MKQLVTWGGVVAAAGMLAVLALTVTWYPPGEVLLASPVMLFISVVAMVVGLIFQYAVWHLMVKFTNPAVSCRDTYRAHSLAIWAKYVPGKVWSVLGRAGLLARVSGIPMRDAVAASTGAQLIMLITGGLVAAPVIVRALLPTMVGAPPNLGYWSVLVVVCLVAGLWICLLMRRQAIDASAILNVTLAGICALVVWSVWGVALAALIESLGKSGDVLMAIGQYAAGVCAGIVSVVVPGGLGVREGVLSFLLVIDGYRIGDAAAIGILVRLISLAGEFLIFVLGLVIAGSGMAGNRRPG